MRMAIGRPTKPLNVTLNEYLTRVRDTRVNRSIYERAQ